MTIAQRPAALLALLLTLTGCGAASTRTAGTARDPDIISIEELDGRNYASAFEAVQSLRPQWLRVRPPTSLNVSRAQAEAGELVIYVDNIRFGDVRSLQGLPVNQLESLERVEASDATQRWGTGHASGAIAIITRRP
jgi:hypothetical protein